MVASDLGVHIVSLPLNGKRSRNYLNTSTLQIAIPLFLVVKKTWCREWKRTPASESLCAMICRMVFLHDGSVCS